MPRTSLPRHALAFALLLAGTAPLAAQSDSAARPTASGAFRLYKYLQPVGEERYEVFADGTGERLVARSSLNFLGGEVPLQAELRTRADGTPVSFRAEGRTSTQSSTSAAFEVRGARTALRQGATEREITTPRRFFAWAHYGPFAIEEALFRYWRANGRPDRLPLLPAGEVRFRPRGADTVRAGARAAVLERFSVDGLVWGTQTAWFDADGRLAATVSGDAELDRMESVREGYESSLAHFAAAARRDGLADLRALAARIRPEREGTFALVNARLIDGTGRAPVDGTTILVRDGRIAAVGRAAEVDLPAGVARVDVAGATVLPGLWDMHVHYSQPEWLAVSLATGVTTARDAANELDFVVGLRDAVREGRALGPRLLLAGVIDGGEHPVGHVHASTAEEARAHVRRYKERGFEQIKIYGGLPPALVRPIAEEAHRLGMTVTGHVPTGMTATEFVEAGADQINHVAYVLAAMAERGQPLDPASEKARRALALFRERGTVVEPTLGRMEQFAHPRDSGYARYEPGVAKAPLELRESLETTGAGADVAARAMARHAQLGAASVALHRAGIPLVLGSDLAVPGHTMHREMELNVRAGLTPMEAILAVTSVPARVMGMERESGTIEAGKRADLVVVEGDPLADISHIRRVSAVIAAGRLFRPAPLWRSAGFQP
jgi:imidazolonepropionase-like amidohydrolase